jgi:hypothetical protein
MAPIQDTTGAGELSRIPFTVEAEKQLKTLSFWLNIVAWLNILGGIIDLLNLTLATRNLAHVFNAILHFALGTWAYQAANAFRSVATTDVADQAYLVEGFTKLRSLFLVQGVLILVGLAFVAAVFLFFFLHGTR